MHSLKSEKISFTFGFEDKVLALQIDRAICGWFFYLNDRELYRFITINWIENQRVRVRHWNIQTVNMPGQEMMNWGSVELLNWGSVELLNCWIDELLNWGNVELGNWGIDELGKCWIVELRKWWIDELMNCLIEEMMNWRIGEMMNWGSVELRKWWIDELMNCLIGGDTNLGIEALIGIWNPVIRARLIFFTTKSTKSTKVFSSFFFLFPSCP